MGLEDTLELKIFEGEECLVGDGSAENQSGKSLQKAPLGNRLCQFGGTIHEINYPKQHCLVSFISRKGEDMHGVWKGGKYDYYNEPH